MKATTVAMRFNPAIIAPSPSRAVEFANAGAVAVLSCAFGCNGGNISTSSAETANTAAMMTKASAKAST